jgi:hypothetical protein
MDELIYSIKLTNGGRRFYKCRDSRILDSNWRPGKIIGTPFTHDCMLLDQKTAEELVQVLAQNGYPESHIFENISAWENDNAVKTTLKEAWTPV